MQFQVLALLTTMASKNSLSCDGIAREIIFVLCEVLVNEYLGGRNIPYMFVRDEAGDEGWSAIKDETSREGATGVAKNRKHARDSRATEFRMKAICSLLGLSSENKDLRKDGKKKNQMNEMRKNK